MIIQMEVKIIDREGKIGVFGISAEGEQDIITIFQRLIKPNNFQKIENYIRERSEQLGVVLDE